MGEIDYVACACLGAAYGEPFCYCEMRRNGLQEFMDNNPLRKAADENSKEQWKEFWEKGGFGQFKVEK